MEGESSSVHSVLILVDNDSIGWNELFYGSKVEQRVLMCDPPQNKPPSWPYTLDYKIFHDCMIPPCPTKAFPGLWELPLVMWNDLKVGGQSRL